MKARPWLFTVALAASLTVGCASVVPKPGTITLENAMLEVAKGINGMYDLRKGHPKSGLIPSEVSVTFNVSASSAKGGKLYVEAGANVGEVVKIGKVGGEAGIQLQASRGNTVTVKFVNVLLSGKDTLIMAKKASEIGELLKTLSEHEIGILLQAR